MTAAAQAQAGALAAMLDRFCPMHVMIGPTGHVIHAGPTLTNILAPDVAVSARFRLEGPFLADLRLIYGAPAADQAAAELDTFEELEGLGNDLGDRVPRQRAGKYASIARAWRRAWQEVIPFFAFDPLFATIDPPDQSLDAPTPQDHLHDERHRESEPHSSGEQRPTLFSDPPHSATSRKEDGMSGIGLRPATNSLSCSTSASTRERI